MWLNSFGTHLNKINLFIFVGGLNLCSGPDLGAANAGSGIGHVPFRMLIKLLNILVYYFLFLGFLYVDK